MMNVLERQRQNGLVILKLIYDAVGGRPGSWPQILELDDAIAARGIAKGDAEDAIDWLHDEGYIGGNHFDQLILNREGIREIECAGLFNYNTQRSSSAPNRTVNQYFLAPIANIQTGSHSTMTVNQMVGKGQLAELEAILRALHSAIADLPRELQKEAIDVATALETEMRSETPKVPLIKAYVRELKDASVEVSESTVAIMNWSLEHFCQK